MAADLRLVHPFGAAASLVMAVLTVSCATTMVQTPLDEVAIADSLTLVLPDADEMVERLNASQVVTGTYDGQSYNMLVELQWRPGSLVMAALNVWGTAIFSVRYDGERIHTVGNRLVMTGLEAEYVLADFLVTYWGKSKLDEQLVGAGYEVVEGTNRRTISMAGEPIIVIEYESPSRWEGAVKYTHIQRGYTLDIETVEFLRL